jgi:predicted RNA binding protein with dsRBD fold (UPF0201 family)
MAEFGRIEVRVEVDVNLTEDPEKVRVAVERVFGELPLRIEEKQGKRLLGRAEGFKALSAFQELLKREQIRDAARRVFLAGLRGNTVTFHLNKQVAYVGHVSFSQSVGESPLGPIRVEIKCDRPRDLIEWLSPKTSR